MQIRLWINYYTQHKICGLVTSALNPISVINLIISLICQVLYLPASLSKKKTSPITFFSFASSTSEQVRVKGQRSGSKVKAKGRGPRCRGQRS